MRLKTWLAILTLSTTSVTTIQALACGNSYEYELDLPTKAVVQAEQRLAEGKYKQAYDSAYEILMRKKPDGTPIPNGVSNTGPRQKALIDRAYRVAAVAVIQSPTPLKGGSDAWAIEILQTLNKNSNSTYLTARIAEGLAKNTTTKSEATALLRDLVEEDLMPDARAWVTWAALQPQGPAREDALKKCQLRAKKPAECVLATQS